jgi:hypothetical protein
MRRLGAVLLLFSVGCGNLKSPAQPTPIQQTPQPLREFLLSGSVADTAYRSLTGAKVEVIAGIGAGTVTTTNEHGRFFMPGTFTGTVTMKASKEGYRSEAVTVPRHPLPTPTPPDVKLDSYFTLQPDGPSVNLEGEYILTLTADSACANLPDAARTRSYSVTIALGSRPSTFIGRVSGAGLISSPFSPFFAIGVAGDFARTTLGVLEQLDATSYLAVAGGVGATVGPSGITSPLNAQFVHCPNQPVMSPGEYWWCGADVQSADCSSVNHQLTLIRH